jgi:hypothetical protein
MMVNRQLCWLAALAMGAFVIGCALVGCSTTRWIGVEPGDYVVGLGTGEAHQAAAPVVRRLEIDRDDDIVRFILADGSEIVASFVPRDRAAWPAGCPTNIYTHRMEVLDIEREELTIEPVTLSNPILVRNCPPDPVEIVLREDGDVGNARGASGSACSWTDTCIVFKPQRDLPWRANDSQVSADEDNAVTFDIIASADEEVDEIDAGTFAVIDGPENGTAISNLERTGTIREDTGFDESGTVIIRIVDLVTYTPDAGFRGTDVFTYQICDMDGYCDTATVTVTVSAMARTRTSTPLPSTATPTPLPPSPTPTPVPATPTITPAPAVERILFAPGATQATVDGYLSAGGTKTYVMHVAAGQFVEMNATVGTTGPGLRFSLVGADGVVVKAMGDAHLRTVVPSTQDYYVELVSDVGAVHYQMSLLIPVRIRFAPGTASAEIAGSLAPDGVRHYVLRALAGQRMIIDPQTTRGQVGLVISGADGQVLLSGRVGRATSVYDGVLPTTQDYLIAVRAEGGTGADYVLKITIPPL